MARLSAKTLRAALARNAPLGTAAAAYEAAVMEAGSVPRRTKELCALLVCALNFCDALLVERRAAARCCGASTEMLNAVWDYGVSSLFTPAESAALGAAVSLTREPRGLPETLFDPLRAAYDDAGILEILSVIGLFNDRCRLANALQVGIERPEKNLAPGA